MDFQHRFEKVLLGIPKDDPQQILCVNRCRELRLIYQLARTPICMIRPSSRVLVGRKDG